MTEQEQAGGSGEWFFLLVLVVVIGFSIRDVALPRWQEQAATATVQAAAVTRLTQRADATQTRRSAATRTSRAATAVVRTATVRARRTATAIARRTATAQARTATAQARRTATAIALENPDIRLRVRDDQNGERMHIEAQSNLRLAGRLEIVIHDGAERKTYVTDFASADGEFRRLPWKFPLSLNAIPRKRLIDRMVVDFTPVGGAAARLNCTRTSRGALTDRYSCNHRGGSLFWRRAAGTATARARRMATAQARAATAQARRTATALARAATAQARTATAQARTATAQARRTATARARQASAATRTSQAASSHAQSSATARSRQRITARAESTAAEARREMTVQARQTAVARTRPTATPTPATLRYRVDYAFRPVNIRECALLSCAVAAQLADGTELAGLRIVNGDPVAGDSRWLAIRHQGRTLYIHLSLVEEGEE